ncbi:MAG: polyprenyl diphosphate synthase [Bacteriovoracia bacterium]
MQTPKHVAIIMDGNGRWAVSRGHPRAYGHVRGASRVKAVVKEADRLGVKAVTLFGFSTENWSRPAAELQVLWKLLKKSILDETEELDRENIRLRVCGQLDRLNPELRALVQDAERRLSQNTGLQLNLMLSYGARSELVRAAALFARDCVEGRRRPEEMSEALMWKYLWTADLGDLAEVDLVIRTSGEMRISNFLLWQAAYAEYYFDDVCWPDFTPEHFAAAVTAFGQRDRRFGGVQNVRPLASSLPSGVAPGSVVTPQVGSPA